MPRVYGHTLKIKEMKKSETTNLVDILSQIDGVENDLGFTSARFKRHVLEREESLRVSRDGESGEQGYLCGIVKLGVEGDGY